MTIPSAVLLLVACTPDDVPDLLAAVPRAEPVELPETATLGGGWLEIVQQRIERDQLSFHERNDGSFEGSSPAGRVYGRLGRDGLSAHATDGDEVSEVGLATTCL